MKESPIQAQIFKELGSRSDVRLFRNSVGLGYVGSIVREENGFITLSNYRRVHFGLMVGSGDLIGWRSVVVTPEMVGKKIGVFLSLETKGTAGKTDKVRKQKQENWRDVINQSGGIAGIVRNVSEAIHVITARKI